MKNQIIYTVAAIVAFSAVGALVGAISGVLITLLTSELLGGDSTLFWLVGCTMIGAFTSFAWVVGVAYKHRHAALQRATTTRNELDTRFHKH